MNDNRPWWQRLGSGLLDLGKSVLGVSDDASNAYMTSEITNTIEDTTSKIVTLVVVIVGFKYFMDK